MAVKANILRKLIAFTMLIDPMLSVFFQITIQSTLTRQSCTQRTLLKGLKAQIWAEETFQLSELQKEDLKIHIPILLRLKAASNKQKEFWNLIMLKVPFNFQRESVSMKKSRKKLNPLNKILNRKTYKSLNNWKRITWTP